ncbi:MAG: ferrous iron transport protein A [bacterium]|nr:ferrous iron transport protein A [bacterium]
MGLETQVDRRERGWLPLDEAVDGTRVRVRNVFERDRELLEYLDGLAVRPGAELDVLAQNVDETVTLRINGTAIHLGRAAANRVWVEPLA